jgi:hypothetical protein
MEQQQLLSKAHAALSKPPGRGAGVVRMWNSRRERRPPTPPPNTGSCMPIQIDITLERQVTRFHEIMYIKAAGRTGSPVYLLVSCCWYVLIGNTGCGQGSLELANSAGS